MAVLVIVCRADFKIIYSFYNRHILLVNGLACSAVQTNKLMIKLDKISKTTRKAWHIDFKH